MLFGTEFDGKVRTEVACTFRADAYHFTLPESQVFHRWDGCPRRTGRHAEKFSGGPVPRRVRKCRE